MKLKLALPTGRIQNSFFLLLRDAGIDIQLSERSYRPTLSTPNIEAKLFKPQNIPELLQLGARDLGVTGDDWVKEKKVELVELLDTGLDPVKIIAAGELSPSPRIATEYTNLAASWASKRNLQPWIIRTSGATESFYPEDADIVVDNTSTGETLRASGLKVIDEIMTSSTRIYASSASMKDELIRKQIEDFVLLVESALEARKRVMIEVNVDKSNLERLVSVLPAMRSPTVSALHNGDFVVKSAVKRLELATLLPKIKEFGGSDIVVTPMSNVLP
jgi:ATP phosphoribosyltransferase